MSNSIEDRIAEIIASRKTAPPSNLLSLIVWVLMGIVLIGFTVVILVIAFILLRTVFLYSFAQVTGG